MGTGRPVSGGRGGGTPLKEADFATVPPPAPVVRSLLLLFRSDFFSTVAFLLTEVCLLKVSLRMTGPSSLAEWTKLTEQRSRTSSAEPRRRKTFVDETFFEDAIIFVLLLLVLFFFFQVVKTFSFPGLSAAEAAVNLTNVLSILFSSEN